MRAVTLVLCAGAVAVAGGLWWHRAQAIAWSERRFGSDAPKTVVIPAGTIPRAAAELLAGAGVLSDARLAQRYLRHVRYDPGKIQPGRYTFRGALLPGEVFDRVYAGRCDAGP
jgi:cell division protein YceG involved in septum cleavage